MVRNVSTPPPKLPTSPHRIDLTRRTPETSSLHPSNLNAHSDLAHEVMHLLMTNPLSGLGFSSTGVFGKYQSGNGFACAEGYS
jgi:hypothetical protein